jgi:hypothetical protein
VSPIDKSDCRAAVPVVCMIVVCVCLCVCVCVCAQHAQLLFECAREIGVRQHSHSPRAVREKIERLSDDAVSRFVKRLIYMANLAGSQ